MKTTKGYGISIDGHPGEDYVFFNKDERNEMALALYDELVYELWVRFLNWYDENNLQDAKDIAAEHFFCYDTLIVEG